MSAKLSLVGAGPGDPELITLKAIKVLEQADVILYDALVSPQIFNLIKNKPELIYVGKRKGQHSHSQEQINQLILENLELGKHVVRLKGGDPLVFARGVEELELAAKYNYGIELIPGLTSGLALASLNNIPLTRREQSDEVILATGHQITDAKLKLWAEQLASGSSLIIYMGLSNVVQICENLQTKLGKNFPAIAICHGSLDDQKKLISNLSELAQRIIDHGLKSPTILLLGQHISPHCLEIINSKDTAISIG